jgi:hypothetical protein
MTAVPVVPVPGGLYEDVRHDGHALRVSYHAEQQLCVVSIWRGNQCAAAVRLDRAEIPDVIGGLLECLAYAPSDQQAG